MKGGKDESRQIAKATNRIELNKDLYKILDLPRGN